MTCFLWLSQRAVAMLKGGNDAPQGRNGELSDRRGYEARIDGQHHGRYCLASVVKILVFSVVRF